MRDGGDSGGGLYMVFAVVGARMALGFSPTPTGALTNIRPEGAADASGVLVTVTQLGRLIGVAGFGTFCLNRLDSPGTQGSGEALWVGALALSAATVVGVSAGLVRRRRPTGSRQG
ncbi:hypothetical protein [Streptomyces brevispora]|uniref:hypothetical protein n=1 Tax=Streptomyces brevispora TaxID=887462 RepID=UPI0035D840F0